jgi:hypothetical protein
MYYRTVAAVKLSEKEEMHARKIKEDENLLHCNQQRCLNHSKTPLGLH